MRSAVYAFLIVIGGMTQCSWVCYMLAFAVALYVLVLVSMIAKTVMKYNAVHAP